jgi:hypothetical protein
MKTKKLESLIRQVKNKIEDTCTRNQRPHTTVNNRSWEQLNRTERVQLWSTGALRWTTKEAAIEMNSEQRQTNENQGLCTGTDLRRRWRQRAKILRGKKSWSSQHHRTEHQLQTRAREKSGCALAASWISKSPARGSKSIERENEFPWRRGCASRKRIAGQSVLQQEKQERPRAVNTVENKIK